ncbi:hypothetical protein FGB62_32g146 [Gracilaria domingensis]|nr:hypothetical protein FGB62_32g146 [Gracilaria domingensis]
MLALRSSLVHAAALVAPRRSLAIVATVKKAPDTSTMDFPAPSHVSLASEAADLAQQLNAFYTNPVYLSRPALSSSTFVLSKRVQVDIKDASCVSREEAK